MTVTPVFLNIPYRPFFQAVLTPVQIISGIFLQAQGYLLLFLGAMEWGKSLKEWGEKINCSACSLLTGIWAYGRRFLIHSDNYEVVCQGSCYWFIDQMITHSNLPLEDIALHFDNTPPRLAIEMHRRQMMPAHVEEEKIWQEEAVHEWPPMPELDPGIYTFLVGYSKDAHHPGQAHRVVFVKKEEQSMLFDPSTGLSLWDPSDWKPLLSRIASYIRESNAGFFTLQCYQYEPLFER